MLLVAGDKEAAGPLRPLLPSAACSATTPRGSCDSMRCACRRRPAVLLIVIVLTAVPLAQVAWHAGRAMGVGAAGAVIGEQWLAAHARRTRDASAMLLGSAKGSIDLLAHDGKGNVTSSGTKAGRQQRGASPGSISRAARRRFRHPAATFGRGDEHLVHEGEEEGADTNGAPLECDMSRCVGGRYLYVLVAHRNRLHNLNRLLGSIANATEHAAARLRPCVCVILADASTTLSALAGVGPDGDVSGNSAEAMARRCLPPWNSSLPVPGTLGPDLYLHDDEQAAVFAKLQVHPWVAPTPGSRSHLRASHSPSPSASPSAHSGRHHDSRTASIGASEREAPHSAEMPSASAIASPLHDSRRHPRGGRLLKGDLGETDRPPARARALASSTRDATSAAAADDESSPEFITAAEKPRLAHTSSQPAVKVGFNRLVGSAAGRAPSSSQRASPATRSPAASPSTSAPASPLASAPASPLPALSDEELKQLAAQKWPPPNVTEPYMCTDVVAGASTVLDVLHRVVASHPGPTLVLRPRATSDRRGGFPKAALLTAAMDHITTSPNSSIVFVCDADMVLRPGIFEAIFNVVAFNATALMPLSWSTCYGHGPEDWPANELARTRQSETHGFWRKGPGMVALTLADLRAVGGYGLYATSRWGQFGSEDDFLHYALAHKPGFEVRRPNGYYLIHQHHAQTRDWARSEDGLRAAGTGKQQCMRSGRCSCPTVAPIP